MVRREKDTGRFAPGDGAAAAAAPRPEEAVLGAPDDWAEMAARAADPECPPDELDRWASHPDPVVRGVAVSNTNCPRGALDRAASDPDPDVREAVAGNPSTPHTRRWLMAVEDPSRAVRTAAINFLVQQAAAQAVSGRPSG